MAVPIHRRQVQTVARPMRLGGAQWSNPPWPLMLLLEPQQVTPNQWLLQWVAFVPGPYYVWVDGAFRGATYQTAMRIVAEATAERAVVDVFTSPDAVPEPVRSSRFILRWGATDDTREYRLEQYIDSSWETEATFTDDGGADYTYRTSALADSEVHQLRVVPIGNNGLDGTPLAVSKRMVRHPSAPNQVTAFNDGEATLTLSAVS